MNKQMEKIKNHANSGRSAGPGRPKGVPNKTTAAIKEMIIEALNKAGGVDYLVGCAQDPKTASAFLGLVGKVLPTQASVDVSSSDGSMRPMVIAIRAAKEDDA